MELGHQPSFPGASTEEGCSQEWSEEAAPDLGFWELNHPLASWTEVPTIGVKGRTEPGVPQ